MRRGPAGPPAGLTPILRLVGLIALAILVIVLVVFWIQGCQSDAKARSYKKYMQDASAVAKASKQTGATLNSVLVTPGIKETTLVTRIDGSGMRVPSRSKARNAPSQSWPKWMLWWAAAAGNVPRTPASHTAHDGE